MGVSFRGLEDFSRKLDALNLDNIASAAAPQVERRVREIIASKQFAPRADGSSSTANDLADKVSVVATANGFKVVLEEPASYVHSGTSRMQARPLFDDSEIERVLQDALSQAMAEVMR